jgi:[acyl-carrier-protein] S-malonyltransferase
MDPLVLEPLLAAVSGAYADVLRARGETPAAVCGYSAGHVPALYAAGVIDRATCIRIACIRGAALSSAASAVPGGMIGVHGLPEHVLTYLAEDDPVEPASIGARNGPALVVYSGSHPALARAAARATKAGAVVSGLLDVAGPWHTPLLEPASVAIETAIAALPFRPAKIPVYSTVTGLASKDAAFLRWNVAASVARSVEWHAAVQAMLAAGMRTFVEVSPGRVLWGLLGQQDPAFGFKRRYQECIRGPAPRIVRAGSAAAHQQMPTKVSA